MPLIIENIRWVFFDLGYTLINEDGAAFGRLRQVCDSLAELGVKVTLADLVRDLEEASERYDPSPFASVLDRLIPDPQQQDLVRKSGRYPKELEEPYPDAKPLLTALAGRYQLGVIANQPAGTEQRLRNYGLDSFFSVCLSSTEMGIAKPDPEIFRIALEQAGCRPRDAVMVGDRIDNDIKPAKSLGMQTVRILQGVGRLQKPRTDDERPDATVKDLAELATILID